jgi:deoxyribodipyrimidine photo-lyase
MVNKAIFWFRNDLRLQDNQALSDAINQSKNLLLIYIVNPDDYRINKIGLNKTGSFRSQFLGESVLSLQSNLKKIGSQLYIFRGEPCTVICKLMEECQIDALFASKELAYDELKLETNIQISLDRLNAKAHFIHNNFLIHPEDLPFSIDNLPEVFTDFRKQVEKSFKVRNCKERIDKIPTLLINEYKEITIPEWQNKTTLDRRAVLTFEGGENKALERIQSYLWEDDLLKNYKETRNGMIGAAYSSKFSPWLANGCISPRLIYAEIKKYEQSRVTNQSTYWLVFELLWRDFFRFLTMKYCGRIFLNNGIKGFSEKKFNSNYHLLEIWMNGKTKEPFVNANMIELKLTGFMSNRGRQIVASYLVNDMKVNWRMGAEYFESQLIDYDVYSNWCNWMYIAGVGTDPRDNRYFNISKQEELYDPKGDFVKLWLV